jgi:hypothetical protein
MPLLQVTDFELADFNDTEIWRTSTAEPNANGIVWTYTKDATNFLSLWKQPQKLIFDLGNLIDDRYTGRFNTTLTATFFTSAVKSQPADLILPISKSQSAANLSSAFMFPQDAKAGKALTLPRNAKRAVFSISAVGQADEEFWWSNVPQSRAKTFGNQTLPGYSPWREVQVLIDDKLAGVAWPFPVIFTGGVIPSLWRPVVGIDAFDMKEDEIDITPWLPVLSDGKEHNFEIRVVGLNDDGKQSVTISPVGNYWIVTGKVFLWLDQPGAVTTGDVPRVTAPDPKFELQQSTTQSPDGKKNATLSFKLTGSRDFIVEGNVITSDGPNPASWKQTLAFSNAGLVDAQGNSQLNDQLTTGFESSSRGYTRRFRYPLYMNSSGYIDEITRDIDIRGNFTRSKTTLISGDPTFPSGLENYVDQIDPEVQGCLVNNTQKGQAMIQSAKNVTKGNALTEQVYTFNGIDGDVDFNSSPIPPSDPSLMYSRHVLARNDKLTNDEEITREAAPPLPNLPNRVVPDYDTMQLFDINDVDVLTGRKYAYLLNQPSVQKAAAMQQSASYIHKNLGTRQLQRPMLVLLAWLSCSITALFIS